MRVVEYRFTIDGLPVGQVPAAMPRHAMSPRAPGTVGEATVRLRRGDGSPSAPGHGWCWDEVLGTWHLQRRPSDGIVEDLTSAGTSQVPPRRAPRGKAINAQMARYQEQRRAAGPSDVRRWQEAARYFTQAARHARGIWNVGVDDYAREEHQRRSRCYANWIDASLVIAIHNNGGQETGDGNRGSTGQTVSRRKACALAEDRQPPRASRLSARDATPNWVDRGLRTCNGCKGENRLASRPAVIVEIAYMDTPSPDNDALHDEAFKRLVARGRSRSDQEWGPR